MCAHIGLLLGVGSVRGCWCRQHACKSGRHEVQVCGRSPTVLEGHPIRLGGPEVRRPAAQVLGRNLEALITAAENIKGKWGDDFVSVEHLVLALEDDTRFGQPLLRQEGLSTAKLEEAIKAIRGGNRVTDQARARAARAGRSQRCRWAPLSVRVQWRFER